MEQAKTDEVIPIKQGQAAIFMIQSAMQVYYRSWRGIKNNQKIIFKKELFENATELAKSIPAYSLRVSLNGRFWNKMEKVLSWLFQSHTEGLISRSLLRIPKEGLNVTLLR